MCSNLLKNILKQRLILDMYVEGTDKSINLSILKCHKNLKENNKYVPIYTLLYKM